MRRPSSIMVELLLATSLGAAPAGCGTTGFACQSEADCAGLAEGQCEPAGRCSIPDADCPSGRRYAPYSAELTGVCVDAEGTGSSQGSQGDPTSADESTDTEASVAIACSGQLLVDEPFAAPPIDTTRWQIVSDVGVAGDVIDGALRLSVIDATGYFDLVGTFGLPGVGSAGIELTSVPPLAASAEAFVVLTEGGVSYGFQVTDGRLSAFYDAGTGPLPVSYFDYDPVLHRWLRLAFDQGSGRITWQTGPAPDQWGAVAESAIELTFDITTSQLVVGAGVFDGPLSADPLATFGHVFVCVE
jgi:hypothetical protein